MTAQAGGAPSSLPADRDAIRREMRHLRRTLTPERRTNAAREIARRLVRLPHVKPGARVAVYLATRGEVDLTPFISLARRRGCRLYLPRIVNARTARMEFFPFDAGSRMRLNAFGIAETIAGAAEQIAPHHLDLILAPLVAFDAHGARLGMGAGYYDRRLSWLRFENAWRRPRMVGIAYDFQRVQALDSQPWDVRLDAVVTESGVQRTSFSTR